MPSSSLSRSCRRPPHPPNNPYSWLSSWDCPKCGTTCNSHRTKRCRKCAFEHDTTTTTASGKENSERMTPYEVGDTVWVRDGTKGSEYEAKVFEVNQDEVQIKWESTRTTAWISVDQIIRTALRGPNSCSRASRRRCRAETTAPSMSSRNLPSRRKKRKCSSNNNDGNSSNEDTPMLVEEKEIEIIEILDSDVEEEMDNENAISFCSPDGKSNANKEEPASPPPSQIVVYKLQEQLIAWYDGSLYSKQRPRKNVLRPRMLFDENA